MLIHTSRAPTNCLTPREGGKSEIQLAGDGEDQCEPPTKTLEEQEISHCGLPDSILATQEQPISLLYPISLLISCGSHVWQSSMQALLLITPTSYQIYVEVKNGAVLSDISKGQRDKKKKN